MDRIRSTITATWRPSHCCGASSKRSPAPKPSTDHRPTWASIARDSPSWTTMPSVRPPGRRSSAGISVTRANMPWAWRTETVQRVELLMKDFDVHPKTVPSWSRHGTAAARRRVKGIRERWDLLRRGDPTPRWHHCHRLQLTPDARRVQPGAQRHQASGGHPGNLELLPPRIIESIRHFKTEILEEKSISLDLENPDRPEHQRRRQSRRPTGTGTAQGPQRLRGTYDPYSHPGDEAGLRRLGVNVTSDPDFATKNLFIS